MVTNALLRLANKGITPKIKINLKPFPHNQVILKFYASIEGLLLVFIICIGYSFIPASLVRLPIKENIINSKQ